MKTQLPSQLPEEKLKQLEKIKERILETGKAEMIILYGSFARGDFKEEEFREIGGYMIHRRSDLDILVVIDQPGERMEVEKHFEGFARPRMIGETELAIKKSVQGLGVPVQLIVEQIDDINEALEEKQYFYYDIYKEGVLLYDSAKCKLSEPPGEVDAAVRLHHAEENFDGWLSQAKGFFQQAVHAQNDEDLRMAAFDLEQTCEMCYKCLLLVYTHYAPNEHDLYELRDEAEKCEPALIPAFPLETPEQQNLFDKLNLAYIGARYFKTFTVTEEEVNYWKPEAEKLMELTRISCEEKIRQLKRISN